MFLGAEVPCSVLRAVEVLVELEGVFAGLLELGAGVDVGVDVERLCLGSVSWDSLFGSEFLFLLGMRNMMMSMDKMRWGGIRGIVKRRNVFVLAVWLLKC